jgi:glycosyltransferase involved in cell wall biosynthesis
MPPHVGGIETQAEALFHTYRTAGLEARWIASRVPAMTPSHDGCRIRVGCWNGLERTLGVPWPLWGPGGMREIARLVRWADVLHVHDCLYQGSLLTVWFARRAGKPVLLSQHIGFVRYRSAILNRLEDLAYRTLGRGVLQHASHVVYCTPTAEAFVPALLGARPEAATTIPYGIDADRFRPATPIERAEARRALVLPEAARVVLFVGRLVEKKGADLLPEICRRMPSCHFLLVGDGPLRPPARENLTWLPFVPPERMEVAYRAADALLLPSHSEGFPLAVHEAMAAGVPVVVARGEAYSAVLDEHGACVSAARTATALCAGLCRLLETPGLAATVSRRARDLATREWSLGSVGARYLALIQDLTSRR